MQSLHRRLRTHGDHLSSWTSLLRNIYRWAFSSPRNISPVLKPRQGVHQITFAVTEVVNIPQRSSKPQENGVAEQMNRTIVECARAMLNDAGLPNKYWGDAVLHAAHIINRLPTKSLESKSTPYEAYTGNKPSVAHLRVFGCTAHAHIPRILGE